MKWGKKISGEIQAIFLNKDNRKLDQVEDDDQQGDMIQRGKKKCEEIVGRSSQGREDRVSDNPWVLLAIHLTLGPATPMTMLLGNQHTLLCGVITGLLGAHGPHPGLTWSLMNCRHLHYIQCSFQYVDTGCGGTVYTTKEWRERS